MTTGTDVAKLGRKRKDRIYMTLVISIPTAPVVQWYVYHPSISANTFRSSKKIDLIVRGVHDPKVGRAVCQ